MLKKSQRKYEIKRTVDLVEKVFQDSIKRSVMPITISEESDS